MGDSVNLIAFLIAIVVCGPGLAWAGLGCGPEEFVQASGTDIQVLGYSVPSFVDWNNDLLKDLVVGEGGGWGDAKVRVYLNVGTEAEPGFEDFFYARSDGADLTCPAGGCLGCFPRVVYWDDDDRKDLLTGNTDGLLLFYSNVGTDSLPTFGGYSLVTANGTPVDLAGSPRSRPFVCTWTGDGHFGPKDGYWDLLVGSGDGKIRLYRGLPNTGDFDADGDIDVDDLRQFVAYWRQEDPPETSPADLNADGVLDYADLETFVDLMLTANTPAESDDGGTSE